MPPAEPSDDEKTYFQSRVD